jgi:hypothetical protein
MLLAAGAALTLLGLAFLLEAKILLYGLLALLDLLRMLLRFAFGVVFEFVEVTGHRVLLSGGRPAVLARPRKSWMLRLLPAAGVTRPGHRREAGRRR